MNTELNERVARAIGWHKDESGHWTNTHGIAVSTLPDFSGTKTDAYIVIRYFESMAQLHSGNQSRFFKRYRHYFTAMEICALALDILQKK